MHVYMLRGNVLKVFYFPELIALWACTHEIFHPRIIQSLLDITANMQ